jgi:hypothetical protein
MTILKEEIASRTKGPMAENEDWWRLCYDTNTNRFFVEHAWDHVKINGLTQDAGTSEHDADTWKGQGAANIPDARKRLKERVRG